MQFHTNITVSIDMSLYNEEGHILKMKRQWVRSANQDLIHTITVVPFNHR